MGPLITWIHGFLGMLMVIGLPWSLAELFLLRDRAGLRRLKTIVQVATIASLISCVILAISLYMVFYPPAKKVIKEGPRPWMHSIVMETKEHFGLLVPLVLFSASSLIGHYSETLIEGKDEKRAVMTLLVIALVLILLGIGLGAELAKEAPIK